jgi:hypothetical protein
MSNEIQDRLVANLLKLDDKLMDCEIDDEVYVKGVNGKVVVTDYLEDDADLDPETEQLLEDIHMDAATLFVNIDGTINHDAVNDLQNLATSRSQGIILNEYFEVDDDGEMVMGDVNFSLLED